MIAIKYLTHPLPCVDSVCVCMQNKEKTQRYEFPRMLTNPWYVSGERVKDYKPYRNLSPSSQPSRHHNATLYNSEIERSQGTR